MTYDFPVALGDEVRDTLSGITGTVVGLTIWLNQCRRAQVQPAAKRGAQTVPEGIHIDVEQLVVVRAQRYVVTKAPTGGPKPAPRGLVATREVGR